MRIERDAIERELRAAGIGHPRVIQTGIGKDAILAAAESVRHEFAGALFVLAGAAGGLVHLENPVPPISRVIDEHGNSWTPLGAEGVQNGVTLIAVDHIVSSPADKHALPKRTGAAIVDMEGARIRGVLRAAWASVDGGARRVGHPDETLPGEVLGWITPKERRGTCARADLLVKPWLIPHIVGVVRRSNRVLPMVGRAVVEVVRAHGAAIHGIRPVGRSSGRERQVRREPRGTCQACPRRLKAAVPVPDPACSTCQQRPVLPDTREGTACRSSSADRPGDRCRRARNARSRA